jgi:PAS domain S-box-containing protein
MRLLVALCLLAVAPCAALAASPTPAPITTPVIATVDWRAVLAAGSALILALVWVGRRRRQAQRLLETQLRFERALSELTVSIATVPPEAIDEALDPALSRVAAILGIDWVWRWDSGNAEDASWDPAPLRAAEPAWFGGPAELPPGVRRGLAQAGAVTGSAVAVPLIAEDVMSGALFWVSRDPDASWRARTGELRMVAAVVATVLQRKHAELARGASDTLRGAILDSLPAHIAVLDREGTIIAVNHGWIAFGHANGITARKATGPGTSYLAACIEAARAGYAGASEAVTVIERACRGRRTGREVEYRADSPDAERWFLMTGEPLRLAAGGAVVTHWDITTRKVNEIAMRESEDRFRRMADALPVAIRMSDLDGGCSYFNKEWLRLTGRTLEEECGDGWLESVHADDRTGCLDACRRALQSRDGFRIEYRIRRHDGEFRWLLDTGMPRYGSDGAFHGHVGSCVDITDRKEAEQMLRGLSHHLMQAQDEERRRIARELHDHLSQQLALLAIDLQQLAIAPSAKGDGLVPSLEEAWRRTTEIASDVHALSHRLHPSKMEALGLVATIQAHCRDVSRQGLAVRFRHGDVSGGISPERALSLFRVLEEALSNVIRHSGSTEALVTLLGGDSHVVLRVADGGRGFSTSGDASSGLGLISMRERLQSLNGSLSVTSAPGQGTVIEARMPADAASSGRDPLDVVPSPAHGTLYDGPATNRPIRWKRAESA